MPTQKFSHRTIETLKPGMHWDATLPGFGIRVGKGRRTWLIRYRAGGKNPRHTLGHFPAMSLAEARQAAGKAMQRIDSGARPPAPDPHPRSSDALTLGSLIDRYEKLRRREGGRVKTLDEAMRSVRKGLASFLDLPAAQFSKADLREARDELAEDAPIAANRLLGYFGPVMSWAAQEDLVAHNFVPDIRRAPETRRTRKLSDAEIRRVWMAAGEMGSYGRLVRFLLVTAQRRGEAAALKFGHVLDGRWRWDKNKAGREHSLRLPPLALEIIGTGGAPDLVFPGEEGELGGWSKFLVALRDRSGLTAKRGEEGHFTLHDLRRTAATRMQELGIDHFVVEAILNHQLPGVAGVYQVGSREREKAEALAKWATALGRIIGERRAAS